LINTNLNLMTMGMKCRCRCPARAHIGASYQPGSERIKLRGVMEVTHQESRIWIKSILCIRKKKEKIIDIFEEKGYELYWVSTDGNLNVNWQCSYLKAKPNS
jgi:hypothetical protein